jgi:prevent-host-death family protein
MLIAMRDVSSTQLRQSIGRLARHLERTGEPVLLKVRGRPVGAIISLRDFRERFVLERAEEEREALVQEIKGLAIRTDVPVDAVVADLRSTKGR